MDTACIVCGVAVHSEIPVSFSARSLNVTDFMRLAHAVTVALPRATVTGLT